MRSFANARTHSPQRSPTHSRARALCKRALLRRAGGSAHVRSVANARTHSPQRSPTHSRAYALCKRALLRHALTPAISSTPVGVRLAGARTRGDRRAAVQCLRFHSSCQSWILEGLPLPRTNSKCRCLGSLLPVFCMPEGFLLLLKSRDGRILTVDLGENQKSRTHKNAALKSARWERNLGMVI